MVVVFCFCFLLKNTVRACKKKTIKNNIQPRLPFCYIHRIYNRMCTGPVGVVVKTAGALVALVGIYIFGYVTGYYVHRC